MSTSFPQLSSRVARSVASCSRHARFICTTPRLLQTNSNDPFSRPSPPRLSPEEQQEFEALLRKNKSPFSSATTTESEQQELDGVHKDIRKGPAPEFIGEVNPKTGEVGGPKNEPLKHGEWSFGGRVTDF